MTDGSFAPNATPYPATPASPGDVVGGRVRALVRGSEADPAWLRPALVGVTALAALLYLWDLTISGYANEYYSAAALAGSKSWSAWFFGSFDAANFITVDKPPVALWLMGLSVRLFGLSSWSILLPQALAGIATVVLLFLVVRHTFGPVAAVIAALVTALTPAAVLMFRYDNPDALLTLLLVAAAGAFIRSLETGATKWVVAAATLVGFAFLTKYLQAYLVLPAFAITYAIAAPGSVRRRLEQLVAAGATVTIASLWWVLLVELIPPSARPFIGGSTNDSVLNLLLGYDGLGRLAGLVGPAFGGFGGGGPGGGAGPGGGGGGGFGGLAGPLRMFNAEFGGQIAWLLPLAAIGLVAGLLIRGRAARTDARRAGYLLWGLWLATHVLVFSFMSGIVHTYYVVAMAPAIGALVGGGVVDLWGLRSRWRLGGLPLAAALAVSAWVAVELLGRATGFAPGLDGAIVAGAVGGAILVAIPALTALTALPRLPALPALPALPVRWLHSASLAAGGVALGALLLGPGSYALATVGTAYGGGDPKAGPSTASDDRFGGAARQGGFVPVAPTGGFVPGFVPDGSVPGGAAVGGPDAGVADQALVDYLLANRGEATWIVATTSANSAAPIQLATGEPVMAMGGFSGSDPAPTVAELQDYVRSGRLRFVLMGGRDGGFGGIGERTSWVTSNCTAVEGGAGGGVGAGRSSLYDCAGAATGG